MITLKLTKQQLKDVQAKRQHINSDNGTVFVGVKGRRHKDGLWHVEVIERPKAEGESLSSFSLKSVLATSPRPAVAEAVSNEPVKTRAGEPKAAPEKPKK